MKKTCILDAVHGYVDLNETDLRIIDSPHFQRLRDLKQLGASYYVFPGASHNRFEHSIGTAYLAETLAIRLQKNDPSLDISSRKIELIKHAALAHDLGHGPFSHAFSQFVDLVGHSQWTHEEASLMMFEDLINISNLEYDKDERRFMQEVVKPSDYDCHMGQDSYSRFLYDIVANERNSIDVDKFDYLARDTRYVNVGYSFECEYLINNCHVVEDEICFDDKVAMSVWQMFHTRYALHKMVYSHKTNKAIELMIADALAYANPYLKITEKLYDPAMYLTLSDSIISFIASDITSPELNKSREIIKRLHRRELYKLACGITLSDCPGSSDIKSLRDFTPEQVVSYHSGNCLTVEDLVTDISNHNYAMGNEDPISNVHFYNSSNPTQKFLKKKEQLSYMFPEVFQERFIRLYLREPTQEKIAAAEEAFRRFLRAHNVDTSNMAYPSGVASTFMPVTPPLRSRRVVNDIVNLKTLSSTNYSMQGNNNTRRLRPTRTSSWGLSTSPCATPSISKNKRRRMN